MENVVHIDFEGYANKLLTPADREILEGLEVSLCIDPERCKVYRGVYFHKELPNDKMEEQDEVINKFMKLLCEDKEFQSAFRFQSERKPTFT